jgi:hypothetical protein
MAAAYGQAGARKSQRMPAQEIPRLGQQAGLTEDERRAQPGSKEETPPVGSELWL